MMQATQEATGKHNKNRRKVQNNWGWTDGLAIWHANMRILVDSL